MAGLAVLGVKAGPAHACGLTQGQPGPNLAVDCDGGGTQDICIAITAGGTTVIECNLARNYDDEEHTLEGGEAVAIYDDGGAGGSCASGDDYCIWGRDVIVDFTDNFYCGFNSADYDDLTEIKLIGGDDVDELYFVYDQDDYLDAHDASTFNGIASGGGGADLIFGSISTDSDYVDRLNGNGGDDGICGYEGDDIIHGHDGEDDVWGGLGADTIYGDADADRICGDDGNDTVDGGGGAGDEVGGGADVIEDTILGGPGASDHCENEGTPSGCESYSIEIEYCPI